MRSFHEPRDDHLFEHDEVKERQQRRADALAERDARTAEETKIEAEKKARATAKSLDTNKRQLMAAYDAAGVAPVAVNADGRPLVSLDFLLRSGWTLREISGRNTLVRPHGAGPSDDEIKFGGGNG